MLQVSNSWLVSGQEGTNTSAEYIVEAANHVGQAEQHETKGDFESAFAFYKTGIACLLSGVQGNLLHLICVCVPMPTHCTITCFGFHARWIDGIKCGLFLNHAPLGQTTLHVG